MRLPFRKKLEACIHPRTYKYFLSPDAVADVWGRCARELGEVRRNPALPLIEIDGEHLLLRAPVSGNPITVIRKRSCASADVTRLHEVFGFEMVTGDGAA